jgi:hypothetical protein
VARNTASATPRRPVAARINPTEGCSKGLQLDEPLFSIRYANDACPLVVLPNELLSSWEGCGPLPDIPTWDGSGPPPAIPLSDFSGTDYERAYSANRMVDVLPVGSGHGIVLGAQTDACNLRWMLLPEAPGPFVLIPWNCPEDGELQVPSLLAATPDAHWTTVCDSFHVSGDTLTLFTSASTGDELIVCDPSYKPILNDADFVATMDCLQCPVEAGTYSVDYLELRFDPSAAEPDVIVCRFRPHQPARDGRDLLRRALQLTGLGQPPTYGVVSALVDLLEQYRLTPDQEADVAAAVDWLRARLAEAFPTAEPPTLVGAHAHGTVVAPSEPIDLLFPVDALATADLRSDSGRLLRHVGERLSAALPLDDVCTEAASIHLRRGGYLLNLLPCLIDGRDGCLLPDGNGGWWWRNPTRHTALLQASDHLESGLLTPLVRLLQVWNRANGSPLGGFHLALMIDAYVGTLRRHIPGRTSQGIMNFSFPGTATISGVPWGIVVGSVMQAMPRYLKQPFPDPWATGATIDDYLSPSDRERLLALLAAHDQAIRDAARMQMEGPYEGAFERWQLVYNGVFPAMR